MTEYDYAKVLEGLHDKILNDEEMLKKVDHPELYALGMCTSIFNRQKAEIESLKDAIKDLRREMSYMVNPNTIGDRHEMGCW